jgi:hypothetical protein
MKLGYVFAATVFAVWATGLASAQDSTDKTQTRVIVQDGKELTVTGCVQRGADGGYTLTNAAGKDGVEGSYILARLGDDDSVDDLDKHVGHRMEISGKAADRGDGKIKVETKSEVRRADGEKGKRETTSEVKGDLPGLPFLGVKSSRMIASVCP